MDTFGSFVDFLFGSLLLHLDFYIGAFLACVAAIGFVLFAGNTAAGLMPALKKTGNVEELAHMRLRAMLGVYLMVTSFIAWEVVSFTASWLRGLFY